MSNSHKLYAQDPHTFGFSVGTVSRNACSPLPSSLHLFLLPLYSGSWFCLHPKPKFIDAVVRFQLILCKQEHNLDVLLWLYSSYT